MKLRTILALIAVAGTAGLALLLPAAAHAGGHVVPGAACDHVGAAGQHGGDRYRCEQRPGEDCPRWHWTGYRPGAGHTWSPRPTAPCPCPPSPSHGASPSASASPTPTPSRSMSASPTGSVGTAGTPATSDAPVIAGGTLPVTGPDLPFLLGLGGVGVLLVVIGVGAIRAGRSN